MTAEEVFFRQQISTLESKGVRCDICVVPGADQIDGDMASQRGIREYLQYLPKVQKAVRGGDYDILHANYGLTIPFAAMQFQHPVVATLWGSDVIGLDGLVTRLFSRRPDAITVRSTEMRELLGREDAYIIPSGIDMDLFQPLDQTAARQHVQWDLNDLHVLFPYSPDYKRKNYSLAEKVVEQVQEEFDRTIHLQTISGVDHSEMPNYMNASDALLLTSSHEGSPNTVKEAMACNVPVVSTDVGDVRSRLEGVTPSGVGSTKTELAKQLHSVLRSQERSNGREKVVEVSWDHIGDQIIDIYRTVLP
nr:glycosyltransferase [Halorubrum salinum]